MSVALYHGQYTLGRVSHTPHVSGDKFSLKPAPHLRTFPWICASKLFVAQIRGIVRARCVSTSSHKSMELCELDVYPHYASKSYTAKQLPWWKDEYRRFVGSCLQLCLRLLGYAFPKKSIQPLFLLDPVKRPIGCSTKALVRKPDQTQHLKG